KKTLQASISPKFLYILNNFESGNFTMFELAEFSSLSSKYTQTLYRLLKQYKTTGYLTIKWADFIEIMDIPKSYPIGMIDSRVLKPAIAELTQEADIFNQNNPIFKKLIYKKIRGKGRGRPVESIEFYFTPRKKTNKEQEQSDRALEYIAQDIRQEQTLKQIKKDTTKNQEPKKLEIRTDLFGNKVSDLDAFLNRHFKVKNKYDGGYDSCKIKELYQNSNGKIQGIAINQENNKTFDLNFESIEHLKNSLKIK
ncbi:TPA: replication initiation protein, partial [Campylobacter fetus subsp. venerealis]|nr:replication initiation protein [Campylobacter fetus subsp. venerealis]